jgi:chromosome segregation ATPase
MSHILSQTLAEVCERLHLLEADRSSRDNDRLLLLDRLARLEEDSEATRTSLEDLHTQVKALQSQVASTALEARRIDACATRDRLESVAAELSERVAAIMRRTSSQASVVCGTEAPKHLTTPLHCVNGTGVAQTQTQFSPEDGGGAR